MRKTMKIQLLGFILILCGAFSTVNGQELAIKNNLLYDLSATPNLGLEMRLAKKWTLDISGGINPFSFNDNRKWKHWLAQGEARYWFCEAFYGHFMGLHIGGTEYNISRINWPWPKLEKEYRYEGWAVMTGISYGYSWVLGKRWNMEATLGIGYYHADYKKYDCATCGDYKGKEKSNFVAPTRIGVNIIYMLK